MCECLFFAACVQVCVARSRPLKRISDVPLLQIRAIHGVPGGSHADRGADLKGLEKRGWEKMETGMGGLVLRVCAGGVSDQARCEPSSIDTRAAVKKTEGGSEDEEEERREGGREAHIQGGDR